MLAMPDAPGQPLLVADDEPHEHGEGERHEGEVVLLHPERREAQHDPNHEGGHAGGEERHPERQAGFGHERGGIGADAEKGRLRQGLLAGIADDQIDAPRWRAAPSH
jgi:hypothetical protein